MLGTLWLGKGHAFVSYYIIREIDVLFDPDPCLKYINRHRCRSIIFLIENSRQQKKRHSTMIYPT